MVFKPVVRSFVHFAGPLRRFGASPSARMSVLVLGLTALTAYTVPELQQAAGGWLSACLWSCLGYFAIDGLVRANAAIERLTGQKARGYRSPSWDLSDNTIDLLLAHGFLYDSSLMGADYWPYRARRGDRVALGEPYGQGKETTLVEMPISWSLDDFPHFEFIRTPSSVLPGLQSARAVMQNWLDEFRYMQQSVDWGVLTYTMHPYVIGRGYRMLALEGLLKGLTAAGAVFMTMEAAAAEARALMFAP